MIGYGFKTVMNCIVCGAATTLGGILILKAIDVAADPFKKSAVKRKFRDIKSKFKQKQN